MSINWRYVAAGLVCAATAHAAAVPDPLWRTSQTVGQMVEMEAQQALQLERARLFPEAEVKPTASDAGPSLRAVYGLNQDVFAEVEIAGTRYLYRAGTSRALAPADPVAPYRLVSIQGGCVVLHDGSAPSRVCVEP